MCVQIVCCQTQELEKSSLLGPPIGHVGVGTVNVDFALVLYCRHRSDGLDRQVVADSEGNLSCSFGSFFHFSLSPFPPLAH